MPEKFIRSKAQTREDFQRVPPLHSQSLDLSTLTEQEERIIQAVIQKDELERSILDAKISEVRKEIQELRKAGALTSGDNQNAICARCKYKFPSFIMPLADHGQRCVSCKFRVCKKCSSREPSGMWLCVLCLKYRQEKLLTGEWMSKGESIGLQGSDLLRVSLRDRSQVSKEYEDVGGETYTYTQRPAIIKEADSDSRNSLSSNEQQENKKPVTVPTLFRNQVFQNCNENSKPISSKDEEAMPDPSSHRKLPVVTKKADVAQAVKKNKVAETVKLFQQRRDSYTHAVENQRATVATPKGNPDKKVTASARHGGATDMHDHTVASSLEQTKHLTHQSLVSTKACSYEDLTNTSIPSLKTTPGGARNVPKVLPEKFRFKRKLSEDQRKLSSSSNDVLSSFDQPTSSVAAKDGAPTPSRPDRKSDGLGKPTYALTNTSSPEADEDKQRKQLPSTGDSFEKLYDQNVNRLVELMTSGRTTSGDCSGKKAKRELPQTPPNGKSKEFLLQKSLSLSDEVAASLVYVSFDTDDYHPAALDHKNNKMISPQARNQAKKALLCSASSKDNIPSPKQPVGTQEEKLVVITTQVAKNEILTVAKKDKAPVVQDKDVSTKLKDTTIKADSKLVASKPEQPSAVESLVENLAKQKWLDQPDKASANLCRSSSNVSDTFSSVTEISEQWGEADSLPYDSDSTMHEKVFDDSFVVDEEDSAQKPGVDVYKSEFRKNNGHDCGVELDASEHESSQSTGESSADSTQNTTQLLLAHQAPESWNPEGYVSDKDSSVDSQLSALESDQGFLNSDLLNASKESGSENTVTGQVKEKKVKPNKNESKLKFNVHLFGKRKLERKNQETEDMDKNENLSRKDKNLLGGNYLFSDHTESDGPDSYKKEAKVTLLSLALRRKLEEEQYLHDLELSSNLPEATLDLDSCTSSHSSVCDDSAMRSDSDELVRDSDSSVTSNNTSRSNTPDPRLQQQQRNHTDQQRSRSEQQKTASEQSKVRPEQKTVQEQPKARSEPQKAGQESQKSTEQQKVRLKSLAEQQLQVPAIAVTQSGDEREEDDDLDELFGNHRPQLLGSRSSLADSRESIYSVYSDAGEVNYGKIPVTGDIFFNLNYNVKSSALEIHIKQCRNLAPVDTKHGRSDPYIKTYLLPDKTRSSKRKTKIKKHTLNPTFDEVLKYSITPAELESRTLWVTVWHNDRFGRNDFLGEVTIPLDYYRFDENEPRWYPLQERSMSQESESPVLAYKGDLFISLKYIPADMVDNAPKKKSGSFRKKSKEKEKPKAGLGEVHVLVREAQNLTAMRANAGSNPFCKGYLLPDVSRSSKQKTPVIKKTTNPQWNHILVFEGVDQSQLQQHGLELTVWDHEKLSSNDFLGGVRLNLGQGTHQGKPVDWMDAKGEEIEAWQSMLERPNEWIDAQLPLRASMGKQNVKK